MRFISFLFLFLLSAASALGSSTFKVNELDRLRSFIGDQKNWPNSTQQSAIWDAFLQSGTQTIRFAPAYGHTSSQNISEELTVEIHPADYPVDWQLLKDFDLSAAKIWDTLLNCNDGNTQRATESYFKGTACSRAQEEIRQLKSSLLSLGTFQLSTLVPAKIRSCKSKINSPDNCRYLNQEIAKANSVLDRKAPMLLLEQIEKNFQKPILHPFFIQLLFEQLSIDDPTARVILHSTGLFGRGGFLSIEFPYFHNSYGSALNDIIRTGQISESTQYTAQTLKISQVSEQDPVLFQMRRSYVIVNLISLSHAITAQDCNLWGLTPALTHRLLEAKRRSSSHTIAAVERLHDAASRVCGLPIESKHFHFFMSQPEKQQAATILGINDVWKTMANIYFQSPTSEAVLWKNSNFN